MASPRLIVAPLRPILNRRLPLFAVTRPQQLQKQQPRQGIHQLGLAGRLRAPLASTRQTAPSVLGLLRTHARSAYSSSTSPYPQPYIQPPLPPPPPPPQDNVVVRFFRFAWGTVKFVIRATFWFYLGFVVIAFSFLVNTVVPDLRLPKEDVESRFEPSTPEGEAVENYINNHPEVQRLRADPFKSEQRPHLHLPEAMRRNNLTANTLVGPDLVTVPLYQWLDYNEHTSVQIMHVGSGLCGHPGIVHGGFVATVMDEGLARCAFMALPGGGGMTATLDINYKAPTPADSYVVLRAQTTRAEGRKAWVTGRLETLPGPEGGEPKVLAEATGLFIYPKNSQLIKLVSSFQRTASVEKKVEKTLE